MKKYSEQEIRSIVGEMSAEEKTGQLFLLAYPGKDPEIIRPLIEKYGICGCYISQDNAETFDEAFQSSSALQEMSLSRNTRIPLLLGVDQEGAWGVLVPESHTGPGNLALGALQDRESVGKMYEIYGREMLSAGYNAILGPCADVNINPKTPIIGTRSFGESPSRVAQCVSDAVKGVKRSGALATLKHFPGHGGTAGDTHREIPRVDKSKDDLMEQDLLPFSAGIQAGADIIMTSHILYSAIDPVHPATLSSSVLQDLLRKEMGFKGVILSDSMNMGAIRRFYDSAASTLMALEAGVDLVMLSEEHYDHSDSYLEVQIQSLETVCNAIKSGQLSSSLVDEKLMRILDLKLNRMEIRGKELSHSEKRDAELFEYETAGKCFSLLQKGLWPLPEKGDFLCINATPETSYTNLMNNRGIGPNQEKPAYDTFREVLSKKQPTFEFITYEEFLNTPPERAEKADALVLVTEDYPLPGEDFAKESQQKLVAELSSEYGEKVIIVGLRSSYELALYPENVTYLCAYSSRSCSAAAAAGILAGRQDEFFSMPPVTPRIS